MRPLDIRAAPEHYAKTVYFVADNDVGFEALVLKASRGIEDIYEMTRVRKDGSRFPAIVSVTALAMKEDREKTRAAGCAAYIAKPLRYQELYATIDTLLAKGKPQAV